MNMLTDNGSGTAVINVDSFVDDIADHADIVCCESAAFRPTETATLICIGSSDIKTAEYQNEKIGDNDSSPWTFWNFLSTWYLPLIFLWLRRSMFGTANIFRSILVGQFLRMVLVQCGNQQRWIEPFVEPPAAFTSNSDAFLYNIELPKWFQAFMDSNAWPPPALTALGILTFVAFVVHPDGLTWFMLGKLRDVLISVLHTFLSCWTMFIQDYGIITTTIALMTLVGIGCLLAILLRNVMPKKISKRAIPPEKKKKKRKGMKGKSGRIRQFRCNNSKNAKPIPEDEELEDPSQTKVQATPQTLTQMQSITLESNLQSLTDDNPSLVASVEKITDLRAEKNSDYFGRSRTLTGDASSDDTSCDSASLRSFASAPTAVTIGSTGHSESTKPAKNPKRNNRRKQSQLSSKRGVRKTSSPQALYDNSSIDKGSVRYQLSSENSRLHSNDGLNSRNSHYPGKQVSTATGRFANLKERDTRFDNSSGNNYRRNNNRNGGKGRNQQGKNNRSLNWRPPASQSVSLVPAPSQESRQAAQNVVTRSFSNIDTHNSQNHCEISAQYNCPYSCSSDLRKKKREELRLLLLKLGLIGKEAAALTSNVPDVDALERLSDRQLQLYGISADNRARLSIFFAGRRQYPEIRSPSESRPHSEIRSPPGLSPVHDEPPTLFGATNRSPAKYLPHLSAITLQQKPPAQIFAYDQHQRMRVTDEEIRIEAELQELGGQMVGSILDF